METHIAWNKTHEEWWTCYKSGRKIADIFKGMRNWWVEIPKDNSLKISGFRFKFETLTEVEIFVEKLTKMF